MKREPSYKQSSEEKASHVDSLGKWLRLIAHVEHYLSSLLLMHQEIFREEIPGDVRAQSFLRFYMPVLNRLYSL